MENTPPHDKGVAIGGDSRLRRLFGSAGPLPLCALDSSRRRAAIGSGIEVQYDAASG
jgi:hypothetical protein